MSTQPSPASEAPTAPGRPSSEAELREDFEAFASGAPSAVVADLELFVARHGGACSSERPILTAWPDGGGSPTPLWLAAMARDRGACDALERLGCALGPAAPGSRACAWRYAAYNGWAIEAASLFEAQHRAGALGPPAWPLVWEAVAEGCKAQSQGLGQRAAGWLDALAAPVLAPSQALAWGILGKAFAEALGQIVPGAGPKAEPSQGWDALVDAAEAAWGKPEAASARAAIDGGDRARDLALARCPMPAPEAQRELDALLAGLGADGGEMGVMMGAALGAAAAKANLPAAERGWPAARPRAKAWAGAAARLMGRGAALPPGALREACEAGAWTKAYALALAGAGSPDGASPALWLLARSRAPSSMSQAMAGAIAGISPAGELVDEQAADVARALHAAGAKAGAAGPDGLDARGKLREPEGPTVKGALESLLAVFAGPAAPAAAGAPALAPDAGLAQRGLGPLDVFLEAAQEREELEAMAMAAPSAGEGARRL